jgi:uncharacterized protein (TIGR03000 family)
LFVDNQLMKTPSTHRVFNTPALEPNESYYYEIRAEVTRNGQSVTQTQKVLLHAGEVVQASFANLQAAPAEFALAP